MSVTTLGAVLVVTVTLSLVVVTVTSNVGGSHSNARCWW